jgi:hypothetical protein
MYCGTHWLADVTPLNQSAYQGYYDFTVRVSLVVVLDFALLAQNAVIVDFAIDGQRESFVIVDNWLGARVYSG